MFEFFKKIIAYFDTYQIPYMLSGSFAMSIYILPRATRDIDFVVHLKPQDIDNLVSFFDGPYYCSRTAVADAVSRHSLFNIIDHASGYKADFVILKNEEYRQTEFKRRQKADFYGTEIYIVSPEDLLISKLIWVQDWQAAQQMDDIRNLSALNNLEREYLNYWITKLKLNTFNLL